MWRTNNVDSSFALADQITAPKSMDNPTTSTLTGSPNNDGLDFSSLDVTSQDLAFLRKSLDEICADDDDVDDDLELTANTTLDILSELAEDLADPTMFPQEPFDWNTIEPTPIPPNGIHMPQPISISNEISDEIVSTLGSNPIPPTRKADNDLEDSKPKKKPRLEKSEEVKGSPKVEEKKPSSTASKQAAEDEGRFRPYQAEKWSDKFQELVKFRCAFGHCQVPHSYKESPTLVRWAKRQRYQYKLKQEGKPSTMTEDRIAALEALGFVWDSHLATWDERINDLRAFRFLHGHSNVPSTYPANPKLAIWVKCQRRQYKLFCGGKQSNMTLERITQLQQLDFVWEVRKFG